MRTSKHSLHSAPESGEDRVARSGQAESSPEKELRRTVTAVNTGTSTAGILWHDFLVVLKQCAFPAVFGVILFGILIPGSTAAFPEVSIFNLDYTHDQLKYRFAEESMLPVITGTAVLFACAVGLLLFSFLTDRRKSAFVLSLGLKREKLFFVRTGTGLLLFLITTGIPVGLSLALNRIALGNYPGMMASAGSIFVILVLQEMIVLLITAAACSIAGTLMEAVVLTATFLTAFPAVLTFLNALMKTFLWGNVYGETTYALRSVAGSLPEVTRTVNPVRFASVHLEKYNAFSRAMDQMYPEAVSWRLPIAWGAAGILLAGLCMLLFRGRRAENAGIAGLSRIYSLLIRTVWPVLGFGLVLEALRSTGTRPAFVSACIAAILLSVLFDVFFFAGRRNGLQRITGSVLFLLVLCGCAGVIRGGLPGYTSRLPDVEKIASVRVSFPGVPALMTEPVSSVTSGSRYYSDTGVELSDTQSVTLVRRLHRQIIRDGCGEFGTASPFENSVFPYDLHISYRLKSGKTIERYYDRVRLKTLASFLELEESRPLRNAELAVVRGESATRLWNAQAFSEGDIFYADSRMQDVRTIRVDAEHRRALLDALSQDLAQQTLEDRYYPAHDAEGILLFSLNGAGDTEHFFSGNSNARLDLTASFVNTRNLLYQWGITDSGDPGATVDPDTGTEPAALSAGSGTIESITLQKFDPYAAMNRMKSPISLLFQSYRSESRNDFILEKDFGSRPSLTDPEQIAQIAPALRSSYFMDQGGFLAAVRYRGNHQYVYQFIPYEEAPEFIRTKMG